MKSKNSRTHTQSWLQPFLHWIALGMLAAGLVLLSFVAAETLDAKLYQADAKHSLDHEIQTARDHKTTLPKLVVAKGDVLGRMDILRLGVSVVVLQGVNSRMLQRGVGHIEGTPFPWEPGNSAIAGHRDTFFRELKDIQRNDEIQFQASTGLFRYEVDWVKVVAPGDVSVLASSNESVLTLVTCYPFYFIGPAPKRFVVRAHRF